METLIGILGLIALLWLLIAAAGAFPLLLLYFADFSCVADPEAEVIISRAIDVIGDEWLNAGGLEPEGAVLPLGIRTALFRHYDNHTALAVYFVGMNVGIDMVTAFPNDVKITTTNTVDGVVAPLAPGSILQCLPSLPLEDRWQEHLHSVQQLREQLNTYEQPMGQSSESMRHSVRRQARYTLTRPWLILAIPFRYFVLRSRYRDITIAEQLDRGWINSHDLFDRLRGYSS